MTYESLCGRLKFRNFLNVSESLEENVVGCARDCVGFAKLNIKL